MRTVRTDRTAMPRLLLITASSPEIQRVRRSRVLNFQQITMPYLAARVPHDWHVTHVDEEAEKLNWKVYQANNVRIGHIQRVITWPSPGGQTVHQYLDSFEKDGKPASVIGKSLEASGASLAPLPAPEVLELAEKAA